MKRKNKLLCLFLSALLVLTVCGALAVSAETYQVDNGSGSGVTYNGTTYSSFNVHTLMFDPGDYVVLPFAGYAGGTYTLEGQYSRAVGLGYDVVGVINGDFANMTTGYLTDYIVTNGEVVIGDAAKHGSMTCVMSDGTIATVAASQLKFTTYFNGTEVPGGISYINRRPSRYDETGWTDAIYYFDSNAASDKCPLPGVAVMCKKLDGTILSIGGTMNAEVVSVEERSNANGITPAKDEFLLYVRAASPLAETLKALKKGDSVTVSTSETVTDSVETVSNATSILANIGYLVKDGKNLAAEDSFNNGAPHSNQYKAQWTAFGTKADGTWVLFTSEGNSGSTGLTLKQVAAYMIDLGCTTVIRLDGGGSSAMYLCDDGNGSAGYKENYGRPVADCLMVVKRSSKALQPSVEIEKSLDALMKQAQGSTDAYVQSALRHAQSIIDSKTSVAGDYSFAMMRLRDALSGKSALSELMGLASGVNYKQYSEYVLTRLREAYANASKVFGSGTATPDDVAVAYARLKTWVNAKGQYSTGDATYPQLTGSNSFYLLRFNSSIQENDCIIFTPGASIAQAYANLRWAGVILLRKNAHGSYVVEKNFNNAVTGDIQNVYDMLNFPDNIVPDDCIVIGAHGSCNDSVRAGAAVGKILVPHGFDIAGQTIGICAYFTFDDATGDGHTYDWKGSKEPTCDTKGAEILTCVICGKTTGSARTIDALGHIWGGWTQIKAPSCTEKGTNSHTCLDCKKTETQDIAMLDHAYENGVCKNCGAEAPAAPLAGLLGDVDNNGKIQSTDYMLLKRHILGTYKLTEEGLRLADIDRNGKITSLDYMFLKRAILGTYIIADPNA